MTAVAACLRAGSSLTTRRVIHFARPFLRNETRSMLSRALSQGTGQASWPRNGQCKQALSSSAQSTTNSDIRKQFKTSTTTRAADTPASSRAMSDITTSLNSQSTKATRATPSVDSRGRLQSLCGNLDSFQPVANVIDLTRDDPSPVKPKTHDPVYFGEDDLSDDVDLDLEYEAPKPLPTVSPPKLPSASLARSMVEPATRATLSSSQTETFIPWSSSPASHFVPPPHPTNGQGSKKTYTSLKRESSSDSNAVQPPMAKRRVLPASFLQPSSDAEQDMAATTVAKKPALWDAPASQVQMQKKQLKYQRASRPLATEDAEHGVPETSASLSSKNVAISLSTEQNQVLDLVVNKGASVFFTGPAGTGKSVLMRAIVDALKKKHHNDPERVAVTASTGLAACNVGGITLHSFSGIGLGKEESHNLVKKIRRNPKVRARWLKTRCLIIDEISMVDGDLFDKLSYVGRVLRNDGRPWGGIQLIITGDFFQLPPVPDIINGASRDIKFAFEASTWSTAIDHTIGLTQVFRQRDPEFARMLNEMRLGKVSWQTIEAFKKLERPLSFNDGVESAELFPTRVQVDNSNERRLRELPGDTRRFDAVDTGEPEIRDKLLSNMMAPKSIELKLNAQVMLIKNLDETLVNGTLGRVIAFSDEKSYEMGSDVSPKSYDDDIFKERRSADGKPKNHQLQSDRRYPVIRFISSNGAARTIMCVPEEWTVELPNGKVQAKRVQLPLILAWALSIHKAQGQTLERVTVNLGRIFEKGQTYVALSRATSQAGLRVLNFDARKVMAHPRVVDFYGKLYSVDRALGAQPHTMQGLGDYRRGFRPPNNGPMPPLRTRSIDVDADEGRRRAERSHG